MIKNKKKGQRHKLYIIHYSVNKKKITKKRISKKLTKMRWKKIMININAPFIVQLLIHSFF